MLDYVVENFTYYTDPDNTTHEHDNHSALPDWCRILLITYMVIAAILAIFGNGVIILVERKNRCKTSTDWLVCFMAANDLTYVVINVPINVSLQFRSTEALLCNIHMFVEKWTVYSSTLLLCTVALDRYWKTCRPHGRFLTQQRALRVCIAITVLSGTISSPLLFIVGYVESSSCTFAPSFGGALKETLHGIIAVTFVIMFVIICVCYTNVAFTIKRKLIQNGSRFHEQDQVNRHTSKVQPVKNTSGSMTSGTKHPPRISRNCQVAPASGTENNLEAPQLSHSTFSSKEGLFNSSRNSNISSLADTKPNSDRRQVTLEVAKRRKPTGSLVDRTTKIMFSVTLVFLLSWLPAWIAVFYKQTVNKPPLGGRIFILFGEEAFIVNTFANPIFYIWLSSAFKERAKTVLRGLAICQRR